MKRLLPWVLVLVLWPGALSAQTKTSTAGAEFLRKAAEQWRGNYYEEKLWREQAEREAAAVKDQRDYWKETALANKPVNLDWLYPVCAIVIIAAFSGGVALGVKAQQNNP